MKKNKNNPFTRYRERTKRTIAEAAKSLGISENMYTKYEYRVVLPPFFVMVRLSRLMGEPVESLFMYVSEEQERRHGERILQGTKKKTRKTF